MDIVADFLKNADQQEMRLAQISPKRNVRKIRQLCDSGAIVYATGKGIAHPYDTRIWSLHIIKTKFPDDKLCLDKFRETPWKWSMTLEVFGTDNQSFVSEYCREHDLWFKISIIHDNCAHCKMMETRRFQIQKKHLSFRVLRRLLSHVLEKDTIGLVLSFVRK
jgi:hypothetical protein